MTTRRNGPTPRKSRRIQVRQQSAAFGSPQQEADAAQNEVDLQRKIRDSIAAAIPEITNSVVSALTSAGVLNNSNPLPVQPNQTSSSSTSSSGQINRRNTDTIAPDPTHSTVVQHANQDDQVELQQLTTGTCNTSNTTKQTYGRQSLSKPLALGIDPKVKAKIWAQEFIDLGSLLTHRQRFQFVEQAPDTYGYEKLPPPMYRFQNIAHWLSAFHIFVSIYCEKYPSESGKLMKYASIIQNLAHQSTEQVQV